MTISKGISKVVWGFDFKGHFKGFVNVRHFKGLFSHTPIYIYMIYYHGVRISLLWVIFPKLGLPRRVLTQF